jgi:hypothetical protein
MTEAEWLAETTPIRMLSLLAKRGRERKLRLYACGCFRRIMNRYPDEALPQEVIVSEQVADGMGAVRELVELQAQRGALGGFSPEWAASNALSAVLEAVPHNAAERAARFTGEFELFLAEELNRSQRVPTPASALRAKEIEDQALADLLRCIFGNPFRPVSLDPSWLTSTVVAIAAGIYADRAFDRLPILADALEDAGCDHAGILAHCRGTDPHARGCWVVDLLLGKE